MDGIKAVTDGISQAESTIEGLKQNQADIRDGITKLEEQLAALPPEAEDIRQQLEEQIKIAKEQEAQIEAGITAPKNSLQAFRRLYSSFRAEGPDGGCPSTVESSAAGPAGDFGGTERAACQVDAQAETLAEKEAELADGESQIARAESQLRSKEQELEAGKAQDRGRGSTACRW